MQTFKIKYIKKISVGILTLMTAFTLFTGTSLASTTCGKGDSQYTTSIDLGCSSQGNGILDLLFGIIQFLSYGVGIVISASIIIGGLQYIGSQGNADNTNHAINRIRNSLIALLLYIFAYPILNYVLPTAVLK